jgi:uncharacterized protein YifN (PemK superfamily)
MALPDPERGLVVSCSYLWRNEYWAGKTEGLKDRPCAIVLVVESDGDRRKVTVVPITHTQPDNPEIAIEIPPKVKRHLELDSERSWVILDELNEFVWPGYDLQPIPGKAGKRDYGFLPPALFEQIRGRIIELRQKGLVATPRD